MADYDPFVRGTYPVGVRTFEVHDPDRGRTVPVEVWYPAGDAYAGHDLDAATRDAYELLPGLPPSSQDAVRDAEPASGAWVPIIFSHGFAGHRRQSTHLCTHLASHGFVVAAPDHVGNTTADVMAIMMGGTPLEDLDGYVRTSADDRPRDASRTLDALLAGDFGVDALDDGAGMAGHSFGGWTTLQTTALDERITAALPLAPAGGRSSKDFGPAAPMADLLDLAWSRDVPTLMIVADEDSVLPLEGMHDLLARGHALDKMVVLVNADHFHFCDSAEAVHDMMAPLMGGQTKTSAEFIPGAHAYDVTNGLGLAHFDAVLRHKPEAASLLARDLDEVLGERGVTVEVVAG